MRLRRLGWWLVLVLSLLAANWWFFKVDRHYTSLDYGAIPDNFWGVTFSTKYAKELGLDWRQAYLALLTDLDIKKIRLPVYWDEVEPVAGQFNYADYDWLIEQGAERGVSFILALCERLPRWPECHRPVWLTGLSRAEIDSQQARSLEAQIQHFRQFDAVADWQLQNEYFFKYFGLCDPAEPAVLDQQIKLLKSLDERPLVLTDSGEFGWWRAIASRADIVGTTMYRVAWIPRFGHLYSAWPAWYYRFKAGLVGKTPGQVIIAELQAEPWPSDFRNVKDINRAQVDDSFSLRQFETNAELARRTKFQAAYFWGAEWWYWMKQQGYPEFWELAKKIIAADHD